MIIKWEKSSNAIRFVLLLRGLGLVLTYLGFNLFYSKCGASQYILYAVLSIITPTITAGIFWLTEPVTVYHTIAIALVFAAVVPFSIGQSTV